MKIKRILYRYIKEILPFKAAVAAVVISVVASATVSAVSESGKNIITHEMDAIGMNGMAVSLFNAAGENITDSDLYESILLMHDTDNATPVIVNTITAVFPNGVSVEAMGWGINEQASDIVSIKLIDGRMINTEDIKSNAFVCLIDESLAEKIYKRSNICGKTVTLTIGDNTIPFKIAGTVKKGSNILNNLTGDVVPDFIYIPYTTMKNLSAKSAFDQIIFTSENTDKEAAAFKQQLADISYRYKNKTVKLTNLSQHKEQISNITDTAFLSLFAVSCVAVIVCSISVASSVNTAVITKQKDIGIKMSIGASRADITREFLAAAIMACITGVFIALAIVFILIAVIEYFTGYIVSADYSLIVFSISATIVLTTIFSFLPSFKAARMPPIKALNRE
ncbi:MAG: ABC transporter permease [Oscillospiraceae bacterium]|nr:ABC transporter permease [Oscillospiraceae bacterium]